MSGTGELRPRLNTPPDRRQTFLAGLHLAVLWAFAVAQPLFNVLSDSPDFFVARGNGRADILILAFGLILVPPLAGLALEWVVGLVSLSARRVLHLLLVAALVAMIVLGALNETALPAGLLLILAAAIGAAVAAAYALTRFVPSLLSVLAVAPAIFLALFLVVSPVSKLVLPQEQATAAPASGDATNPVVLLVLDELPTISLLNSAGRIDRSRYPNFARLAGSANWYRNATSVADLTPQAVPAILTGRRPESGNLPIASDQPDNLFTLLGDSYRLEVNETATALCPEDLCDRSLGESLSQRLGGLASDLSVVSGHLLLPESVASGLPAVTESFGSFGTEAVDTADDSASVELRGPEEAAERIAPFETMLDQIDGSQRSLYFAHVGLPHVPWEHLPGGAVYGAPAADPYGFAPGKAARWPQARWAVRNGYQRHLLQTGFADRLLGQLIARLRAEGIWDRSLVAVVADHGSSFLPGDYRRVATERNLATIAGVPMFIKEPGQSRGRVLDGAARTIDLLPTIADTLGVELRNEVDGEVLTEAARTRRPVVVANRFADRISQPLAEVVRTRDRIADRLARQFGAGRGWASLYRSGPHTALIGTRAPAPARVPEGPLVLDRDPASYLDNGPEAGAVPALVSGSLDAAAEEDVAIAVNGRVASIGRTYRAGGETEFIAMVPPSVYRRGPNSLQVLRILPGGRLRELGRAG